MSDIIQFTLLTTLILLAVVLLYFKNAFNFWKQLGVPHLKPSFPLGNFENLSTKYLGQRVSEIYREMRKRGSKFCGYYMFTMPVFVPISLDLIKIVLTKHFESFHDRGVHSDEQNDPMGSSIITISGERWKTMRTKLSPTFTSGKIKTMFPVITACDDDLVNVLADATRKSEPVAIHDLASRYATDVICSVAFGLAGNSLKDPNSQLRNYGRMVFSKNILNTTRFSLGVAAPALLKIFKINLFNPTATRFFHKVVHDTVAYRESNRVRRNDLIDILIRLRNNENVDKPDNAASVDLTVDQIAAHCFLFYISFETSATAVNFCMFELAVNANIQDKVRAEILSVLKKYNGHVTYDALTELRYLDQVVNETLRKYPSVHTLNRLCTKDFTIPGTNITIKQGTRAAISILGLHMDAELYPEPEKFDPERFTDEEKAKRHACAYLPFGDGPRTCPAMKFGLVETKLFICKMVQNFKFLLHPKVKLPLKLCSMGPLISVDEPILLLTEQI